MSRKKTNITTENLTASVIEGIREKKGLNIVGLHLGALKNAICDQFVICHGTSRVHSEAIADGIREQVKKELNTNPWHSEGFENAEWILLDYVDVVVHVFQQHVREHYKLEELWADAVLKQYNSVD